MAVGGPDVLVVEDDGSMRAAIERLLGVAGFQCTAFVSAEELLAHHTIADAACLVIDLKLPAMSGLELLAALRARGLRTPAILITAHDTHGLRDEAMRRGAADYLVKPFSGTALLGSVRAAIEPANGPGEGKRPTAPG